MEFCDCFAWSYKEMLGLDPQVATHKLAIDPRFRLVKQPPRRFHPELQDDIIVEVEKQSVSSRKYNTHGGSPILSCNEEKWASASMC
jgi:hypothetical protein